MHLGMKSVHSFITEIYITPLQINYSEMLLIPAWLKRSFQARVDCVGMNPGEQSLHQRESIPHEKANHRECTGLPCGNIGKREKEDPPRSIE